MTEAIRRLAGVCRRRMHGVLAGVGFVVVVAASALWFADVADRASAPRELDAREVAAVTAELGPVTSPPTTMVRPSTTSSSSTTPAPWQPVDVDGDGDGDLVLIDGAIVLELELGRPWWSGVLDWLAASTPGLAVAAAYVWLSSRAAARRAFAEGGSDG